MGISPAAVLYDADGHAVGLVQDDSVYLLGVAAKVRNVAGSIVNPSTEDTLATRASETTLVAIKSTDGIKKITDQLPAGTNEIGKVAQGTKGAGANAWPQVLYDASGHAVGVVVDGAVYRLQTEAQVQTKSKGTTPSGYPTSKSIDADTQALHVTLIGNATGIPDADVRLVATDGTPVSVDATYRLMVNTGLTFNGYVNQFLLNGSSSDMNVNGSVTPVVFKYEPGSDADIELISLSLIVEEPTISFGTTFFGATGLTNGVKVEAKLSDVVYELVNMQYTRDAMFFASEGGFDYLSATPDVVRCLRKFPTGMRMKKSGTYPTNDYIKFTVRDNLTSLDFMRARLEAVKV